MKRVNDAYFKGSIKVVSISLSNLFNVTKTLIVWVYICDDKIICGENVTADTNVTNECTDTIYRFHIIVNE